MTIFGGFITGGTVSTDPGDATKLTFSGIVINGALGAVAGDTFSAGGYQVPIASIDGTGAATLVYAFPVALDGEADYAIARDSAERYNPAATNLLVRQYLAKIADASITYVVPDEGDGPTDLIAPDPQEGQKAIRFSNPWKTWLYTEGAWVEQPGSPGGPGPQGEAGATWLAQDAEPTTDYPPNSLWVDTDSAVLDVYELSGSPLAWVPLGFGLKGPQGDASTVPGPQGPIGPAFEPDEIVPNLAGRDAFDDEAKNFAVLVESDSSNGGDPTLYFKMSAASADWSAGFTFAGGGGSGDVVGPSSSTDAHIVLFDGVTGKAIQDSGVTLDEITGDVAGETHAASSKAVPDDADEFGFADSGASWGWKKFTWANLKAALIPQIVSVAPTNSGRLSYTSTTALAFKPYNGDTIKINGSVHKIPAIGIAGLGNPTSVYLNGVAAQSLSINTTYYIYAFDNGGTLTADFSTTGHSVSSVAGNVGVEIKTGDDTRSLIGMVRTGGTVVYASDILTASWFNRKGKVSAVSSTLSAAGTSAVNPFLCWGDEATSVGVNGQLTLTGAPGTPIVSNYIDGSAVGLSGGTTISVSGYSSTVNTMIPGAYSEGYHEYTYRLTATANTPSSSVVMYVDIRG